MWRVWVRRWVCIGSWWGNRREGDHWGDRRRWVDNIRMDLQEVGCGYMDWIGLAQDRQVADACECGNEPSGSMKYGEFLDCCKPVSFSRRTLHHGVSK